MAPVQSADQAADPAGAVTQPRPVAPHDLVLIGGGEHAGVVFEAAATDPAGWRVLGFTDPRADQDRPLATKVTYLGDDATGLAALDRRDATDRPLAILAVGAVGDPAARGRLAASVEAQAAWIRWAVVIHGTAWVSPSAQLDDGAIVLAGAIVNAGAHIGAHAIVNSRAVVEHDVKVGAFSHIGPGAVIGGGARIGSDVTIGLGALIRDHIAVGDGAIVGMGAVVVAEVAPGTTVLGSPARARAAAAGSRTGA